MKNKKKPFSCEKPLIFSDNQQGLILREYSAIMIDISSN